MKLAMINVSLRPDSVRRMLPVGLAYVLTSLKKAGIDFDLIDMDINAMTLDELESLLAKGQYDALGMGCIVTGYKTVRDIAELTRRVAPQTIIFAGNSVSTSIPELLLNNTEVDICTMGEGDKTVVELIRALEQKADLSKVEGIVFKQGEDIIHTPQREVVPTLDELGYPDWDVFDLAKYAEFADINSNNFSEEKVLAYPLSTARGCPHNCTFCYHVFKGRKYRRYSDDCIINEIIRLHETYSADYVMFWDELSFPNTKSIESLLRSLDKLDFNIQWDAPCRAGLFKKKDLGLIQDMRDHGCQSMAFSLENAHPDILEAMNKNITVDAFIEQAHVLEEGGVVPITSVIFGYPQETPESIAMTIDVCEECNIFPSVGFLLPLPATPIYQWALDNGKIADEVEYLLRIGDRQDFHVNLTNMTDEELVGTVSEKLGELANKQGLDLKSVFKTQTYQSPLSKRKRTEAGA